MLHRQVAKAKVWKKTHLADYHTNTQAPSVDHMEVHVRPAISD